MRSTSIRTAAATLGATQVLPHQLTPLQLTPRQLTLLQLTPRQLSLRPAFPRVAGARGGSSPRLGGLSPGDV